jgi:hypothetical protein
MTDDKVTSIQVRQSTKDMLDDEGGKNYDDKIKKLKKAKLEKEEELIKKAAQEAAHEAVKEYGQSQG